MRGQFNIRKGFVDNMQSVCSTCKKGIFIGQKRHWTRDGLIHDDCKEEIDK